MSGSAPQDRRTTTVNLTTLNAALTRTSVSAVNKGLTKTLNPLDTMFRKYLGGAL